MRCWRIILVVLMALAGMVVCCAEAQPGEAEDPWWRAAPGTVGGDDRVEEPQVRSISGYTELHSYGPGETIRLHVSTDSPTYSVRTSRMQTPWWTHTAVVRLEPGVYRIEMHAVGPESCFQLAHDLGGPGSSCWVNYQDLGGLRPGYEVYFADYDVSFMLLEEPSGCGLWDCNADGVIDTRGFLCYLALWAAGEPAAECNGDLGIDTLDFLCFLDRWSAGC